MSMDLFSLVGKTVLITGATGYFGRSMASSLAAAGAEVLVNSRSFERAEECVRELVAGGYEASSVVFDVTDPLQIDDFFSYWGDRQIDIVINNAYGGSGGTIEVADSKAYSDSYDITLVAAHNLLRAVLPNLREAIKQNGDASVINIASMYAMVSPDQRIYANPDGVNPPFYGAAKAALIQWTRYAACEFGKEGIRVNSISPGPFPAPHVQEANPDFIDALSSKVPLGRIGMQREIEGPVLFLASPASSFVTGSNLVVDGGWTSW